MDWMLAQLGGSQLSLGFSVTCLHIPLSSFPTTILPGADMMTMISEAVQCWTWPPCSGYPCSARHSLTGSARSLEVGCGSKWGGVGQMLDKGFEARNLGESSSPLP